MFSAPLLYSIYFRFAARSNKFFVVADALECPFLIARIARSLMRAVFANSFAGISRSTPFSRSS